MKEGELLLQAAPRSVFDVSGRTRAWMLLTNYVPFTHVLCVLAAAWAAPAWWSLPAALAVLFVVPALVVRGLLWLRPVEAGRHELDSSAFRTWWLTAQLQIVFNRLPVLEELLRLVPGAYALWLRLWGAKIGRLVFWSPGAVVLDRPFIRIGDGGVLGVGVRLHPHLITAAQGDGPARMQLWLAPVDIGAGSLVGGFSILAPGVTVAPGSATPAIHALPAFSTWEAGRRVRRSRPTVV